MERHMIILIVSAITFANTILLGFILYHPILKFCIESQKALKKGHEIRDIFLKLPIPLDLRVYFFNITNPSEVQDEGRKPILQEVGPYCYDAYKAKVNVDDNDHDDTLTYNPYDTYFFNATRSGSHSQDDYVTILNPLVVGMVNAVKVTQPRFLGILDKALKVLFKDSYGIYVTAKVRDILFDGITIDCRQNDFSAKAVCSQIKTQAPVVEVTKNVYLFSLFGSRNGTSPRRITVRRGIKNGDAIGSVVAVDEAHSLKIWSDHECDMFRGTDGWIFPSFLKKEDGIWTVAVDLCRSVQAYYVNDSKYHGASVRIYHADFGDMSSRPEEKCYCPAPNNCLPKGVMDLTKCLKVPIYITLPHFLYADEKLLEGVEGLKPVFEKHIVEIFFEPILGTPVAGQRRIQFNLKLEKVEKISIMGNVTDVLHPIMWLEEGLELEGPLLKRITNALMGMKIMSGVKYLFLLGALEGIAYGGYKYYKNNKKSKVVALDSSEGQSKDGDSGLTSASSGKSPLSTLKAFASKHEALALQTLNINKKNPATNGVPK